jgi:hypothetical protein
MRFNLLNTKVNRQSTGLTNWTFFALSVFVVLVFLLTDVNSCDSVDFCATTIFFVVFLGSFFMLWTLSFMSVGDRLKGNNVRFFFLQDVNIQKLVWVPIGYVAVLGVSFLTASWDYEFAAHVGIFISGMIMLVAFFSTNAILIPVLIHGFYNATVVTLREEVLGLSQSPIIVPDIGVNVELFGEFFSEIFFQIILVASSEEFFKVFVIAFVIVATEGRFNSKGWHKWIAGTFAVFVWTIYHTISAI